MKASGAGLSHKTEVGGVALNLGNEHEVRREGERLLKIKGSEGLLVQEMVKGSREIVCGLMRDPQFGVCVMFGIGGILTEVLEDIVFRIAPLTPADSRDMIAEIRGRKIVEPFRGEAAADLDVLCRTLVALGEIGLRHEEVIGVDINPLKIRPDGKPVAVDALVVLGARSPLPAAMTESRVLCRKFCKFRKIQKSGGKFPPHPPGFRPHAQARECRALGARGGWPRPPPRAPHRAA